ncbi:MAG: response regulator [Ignavibacteriales bacterium]|nr:response regulator [Ignavibacteriales bacterium]
MIESKEDAEVMNRLKSNLLANMSHEMRTPLISILGYSELIQEEEVEPDIKIMANNINLGGTRLLTTLDNLLQFSKIETENFKPNLFEVNIMHTLKDAINKYSKSIEQKGLNLQTDFESDNMYGFLDEVLLIEIFTNLIENAIKFTGKGNIMISTKTNNESLIISIADTGAGIPVEKQKMIFEEFRQVSEGLSRGYEGTGLGLTIAKKFVELMNGEISVESEINKGSTFTIKFPNQHLTPRKIKLGKVQKEVKGETILPTILYVEDDLMTINVIEKYLEKVGTTESALTGVEALKKISLKKYDVILIDVNLGYGMNGKEFTRLAREMPQYKTTPIIAVTAYAMLGDKEECLAAGCSDYIAKPFRRQILIDMVKSALNRDSFVNYQLKSENLYPEENL